MSKNEKSDGWKYASIDSSRNSLSFSLEGKLNKKGIFDKANYNSSLNEIVWPRLVERRVFKFFVVNCVSNLP